MERPNAGNASKSFVQALAPSWLSMSPWGLVADSFKPIWVFYRGPYVRPKIEQTHKDLFLKYLLAFSHRRGRESWTLEFQSWSWPSPVVYRGSREVVVVWSWS